MLSHKVEFAPDNTQSYLKPYVVIDLPTNKKGNLKVDKIYISPRPFKNNHELTRKSLEMFLAQQKVEYNEVICSEIPYIEAQ